MIGLTLGDSLMSKRYQAFTISGVANKQTFDAGIESNQAETKKLIALLVHVSGYAANFIQLYKGSEKIADVYDYHFDTLADLGAANFPQSTGKLQRIDLEIDLPLGQRIKACLECGATIKNLFGCYIYEVTD